MSNFKRFSIMYFIYYIAQSMTQSFIIPYLTGIGYSVMERSVIFAVAHLLGTGLQIYVGYLSEKNKTFRKYVDILSVIYIVVTAVLFTYQDKNYFIHFLLAIIFYVSLRLHSGLIEGWTFALDEDCRNRFGAIRAWGSIGWAVGSRVSAIIIENLGYEYVGYANILITLIVVFIYYRLPDISGEKKRSISMKDIGSLFKNKYYVYAIFVLFILSLANNGQGYIFQEKMNALNASITELSYNSVVTPLFELPLFFIGHILLKKFNKIDLLIVSAIASLLKYLLYGLFETVPLLISVGCLQLFTFPVITVVAKEIINDETEEHLQLSSQQVSMSIYLGFAQLFAPLLTGLLMSIGSLDFSFYTMLIIILTCFPFLFIMKKHSKEKES